MTSYPKPTLPLPPVFNPLDFPNTTITTLKMAIPAINNGISYYQTDGRLHTNPNFIYDGTNMGVGTPTPSFKLDY